MDNLNYDAAVAEIIGEAINAAPGETKNSVAKKAFIPHSTLERKLAGGGEWKVSEIRRIASVLGVTPASLYPDEVA